MFLDLSGEIQTSWGDAWLAPLAGRLKLVDVMLLPALGVSMVLRIRNQPRMEVIKELPLAEAGRAAGVPWQGMVKRGDQELLRFCMTGFAGLEQILALLTPEKPAR